MEQSTKKSKSKTDVCAPFVTYVLEQCKTNKGLAADLRRADNRDTEYKSWETLVRFGVNLEKPWERLPFAFVAAAAAKEKAEQNGVADLGKALAGVYEPDSDQAKAKLRRLLACQSVEELCQVLRPLLQLIASRKKGQLDYVKLLKQVRAFHWNPDSVKAQWAQNFYHKPKDPNSGEES